VTKIKRTFIETSVFTKRWQELELTDKDLQEFQSFLLKNPEAGDVIQGTNGARKVRFALTDKGKRGGVRIIYVDIIRREHIHLLLCYAKAKQEDLTTVQKKQIKTLVHELKGE
jgi:mRNA-degrading endonuclease RelE of RelBE toxin-antitoxin system